MRKTTFDLLAVAISCVLILGLLGCPGQQRLPAPTPGGGPTVTEQPPAEQPAQQPAEQPAEQPVEQPVEGAATSDGDFAEIAIGFCTAMSEADFRKVETYCTEEYFNNFIKPMEEAYPQLPEEEKARIAQHYAVDDAKRNNIENGTINVIGETATLSYPRPGGPRAVFGYRNVDGVWKLDLVEIE